ncbi:MAG: molybdopterin-dependent oxidoreductase [Chloroflexi bacterium]|nr:molybdopterin-dependent oxidoreductase [Chloroflexota bacterium]
MTSHSVTLAVNGKTALVSPKYQKLTLLSFLRDVLDLTGTKQSCDNEGTCGSCTVIIDGRARRACLEKVSSLGGSRIETIESLQVEGEPPHPLVQTVIQDGIFQCGYCASGAIMAAKTLLDRNSQPSHEQVVRALSPVLCRCSALNRMDQSVLRAAAAMRGEGETGWTDADTENEHLALAKVTGRLKFTDDLKFPDMLYGKALRSPLPHARVRLVDIRPAEKMPGVVCVLTAKDVPGRNAYGLLVPDQPIFCDQVVRYVGDALALVVAESEEEAQQALRAIAVDLEPLPVLASPEQALEPGAPVLHEYLRAEHPQTPNVLKHHQIRKADPGAAFAQAAAVIEADYQVPFVDHAFMETECSLAIPGAGGRMTVYCGSQGPTFDRTQVAAALGVEESRVRIAHMPVGGAFGGKEDVAGQVLAAVAARATGRPVKVRFDRAESLRVHHKRHAQRMHYKMGATRDGRLLAAEVTIHGDTGAYASTGEAVLFRSATFACGPYVVPHVKVDSLAVHTNNPTAGAFRGFGSPQVAFAAETHVQKLADALGIAPYDFRMLNALDLGEATITGHVLDEEAGAGIKACLKAVKEALDRLPSPVPRPGEKLGVGFACAYKNVGLGSGIPDGAAARISLEPEGHFLLRHGAADLGQGSNETMALIAARTLGVPLGLIRLHTADTAYDPPGGMTTASRATFVSGNATLEASRRLRDQLWRAIADEFALEPEEIDLQDRVFTDRRSGRPLISLADLAKSKERLEAEAVYEAPATNRVPEQIPPGAGGRAEGHRLHFAYCYGAQAAVVAVNEETGEVRVIRVVAAHDVGRAISKRNCIGQIEGAVVQGLGYALSESFAVEEGRPLVDKFGGLGLLRLRDLPEIHPILVEDPHPHGPYGAKGMGELALTPTAPAVVNAIHDAVGIWINELPVTRQKILAAMRARHVEGG